MLPDHRDGSSLWSHSPGEFLLHAVPHYLILCLFPHLQLNLQQADQVTFYTNIEEAAGSDDSLVTFSQAIFDLSNAQNKTDAAKLYSYLSDPNTVATVFAPMDDVSHYRDGRETACC